jgi:hypothetical protein
MAVRPDEKCLPNGDHVDPVDQPHERADPDNECGAIPSSTLYVTMAIIYWICSGTCSQCRLTSMSVIWSERCKLKIIHVTAFSTDWEKGLECYDLRNYIPWNGSIFLTGMHLTNRIWLRHCSDKPMSRQIINPYLIFLYRCHLWPLPSVLT